MQLSLLEVGGDVPATDTCTPVKAKSYAFDGLVIKVTDKDYAAFKQRYKHIEDLPALLDFMDGYYSCNHELTYSWMGLLTWLRKENIAAKKKAAIANYGSDWD